MRGPAAYPPDMCFTLSARGKRESTPVMDFLRDHFPGIPLAQIDSIFGFVEASPLYSGRPFLARQLSDKDIQAMAERGIGLRIPFTNHLVSEEEYQLQKPLIEKYHHKGNSVICTNDWLAGKIREDFPLYRIEASILKEIDSHEKIRENLKRYDTVILPMNLNQKSAFLKEVEEKERITLFGNAGCALTCPDRICYRFISETNKKLAAQSSPRRYLTFVFRMGMTIHWCSNKVHPRKLKGVMDFDLDPLYALGFKRFKLLREHPDRQTGY